MLAVLLLMSCQASLVTAKRTPPEPVQATALLFYPFDLVGPPLASERIASLSLRGSMVAVREAGDAFEVYGPGEFNVDNWAANDWRGSTGLQVVMADGHRPAQALVLRVRLEQRTEETEQEIKDKKGQTRKATNQLSTWIVKGELVHPTTQTVIAEVGGQSLIDPFAEPTGQEEFDPAPGLSSLIERVVHDAAVVAKNFKAEKAATAEPLKVTMTPRSIGEVMTADPLAAELELHRRARFMAPWLTDEQASKLGPLPRGVAVMAPSGKLLAGDLVLSVNGKPASVMALNRLRFHGPGELNVRSADGTTRDVIYP